MDSLFRGNDKGEGMTIGRAEYYGIHSVYYDTRKVYSGIRGVYYDIRKVYSSIREVYYNIRKT